MSRCSCSRVRLLIRLVRVLQRGNCIVDHDAFVQPQSRRANTFIIKLFSPGLLVSLRVNGSFDYAKLAIQMNQLVDISGRADVETRS